MNMANEQESSIAFLLGLHDIHDTFDLHQQQGHVPAQSSRSDHQTLLPGLDAIPLPATTPNATSNQQTEPVQQNHHQSAGESLDMFSNQLSMWMNTNFSFDGPMGHALLADDEKDGDHLEKGDDDRQRDEDIERQRRMAASSAHSNAARDKLRALDRDPSPTPSQPSLDSRRDRIPSHNLEASSEPFHPTYFAPSHDSLSQAPSYLPPVAPWANQKMSGETPCPSSSASTLFSQPQQQRAPGAALSDWDLTSTLALQHLMSKSPDALSTLWQSHLLQQMGKASSTPNLPPELSSNEPSSSSSANEHPLPPMQPLLPTSAESKRAKPESPSSAESQQQPSPMEKQDPDVSVTIPKAGASTAQASDRVKLANTGNSQTDAETNRLALEEDKRRRNTLASARFRIKKKQREAALEMSARELEKQVNELKQENERLRSENDWLRRLIMSRPETLPGFFNVLNNTSGSASNSNGNQSSPIPLPPFDSTMQAIVQHASTANREGTRGL